MVSHLRVRYFADDEEQLQSTDHSLLSVLYLNDSFFSRYVTPQMKNSSVMLLEG